ncbi:hypothetical protein GCM10007071_13770 [Marinobacter zhanjiangensis]|uniref:Uncharacterized protein n=1 Tax=Marinobacter zhanjiangensis TaxID=578215 RepID=A0ABQ3AUK9_9GAMM|nr:hypothetical protein GCM10007071_13770 [Marinobacter zhanjiangensis]
MISGNETEYHLTSDPVTSSPKAPSFVDFGSQSGRIARILTTAHAPTISVSLTAQECGNIEIVHILFIGVTALIHRHIAL